MRLFLHAQKIFSSPLQHKRNQQTDCIEYCFARSNILSESASLLAFQCLKRIQKYTILLLCCYWKREHSKKIILRMEELHKQIVFFLLFSIWWLFDLWLFFRYVRFLLLLIFFFVFTYSQHYFFLVFSILSFFILIFLSYRSVLMYNTYNIVEKKNRRRKNSILLPKACFSVFI